MLKRYSKLDRQTSHREIRFPYWKILIRITTDIFCSIIHNWKIIGHLSAWTAFFSNHSYQQWLRIKNCLSKHNYFVNVKSGLFSIFLVKQHNTPKCLKNSYIFLILEPIGRFVHCKKCSPPNMANKMSRNSNLDHHLCLIFQIWLHNNASWQKGHLIVHLAIAFDCIANREHSWYITAIIIWRTDQRSYIVL